MVSTLANVFAKEGDEVEIICLKFNEQYYPTDERVKVTFARQVHPGSFASELLWLRRYVLRRKPDACIAFTEGVYCATICALLGTGVTVIASERLDPAAMSWQRNLLKKIFLPFADHLVVQTAYIKRYFTGRVGRKTSVIVNPVDERVYEIEPAEKEDRIISVARLYPQKNQRMMIDAFARLATKYPGWKLVIYGEGPLRSDLEAYIKERGMEERVLLPGRSHQVIDEMNRSRIFCMSSDYEGMSNSMIEALCVGLPIVSTRVSGTDELISEGRNGYVVPRNDVSALANALDKLMGDAALRQRFAEESRKKAGDFHKEKISEEWKGLVKRLNKQKRV